jgi:hypothetical protein
MCYQNSNVLTGVFWARDGLIRIPMLRVSFRFAGLDDAQRYAFMTRFDLYLQRGGG